MKSRNSVLFPVFVGWVWTLDAGERAARDIRWQLVEPPHRIKHTLTWSHKLGALWPQTLTQQRSMTDFTCPHVCDKALFDFPLLRHAWLSHLPYSLQSMLRVLWSRPCVRANTMLKHLHNSNGMTDFTCPYVCDDVLFAFSLLRQACLSQLPCSLREAFRITLSRSCNAYKRLQNTYTRYQYMKVWNRYAVFLFQQSYGTTMWSRYWQLWQTVHGEYQQWPHECTTI